MMFRTYPGDEGERYEVCATACLHPDPEKQKKGIVLLHSTIKHGLPSGRSKKPSSNIVFVADVSGSMSIRISNIVPVDLMKESFAALVSLPELKDAKYTVITFADTGQTLGAPLQSSKEALKTIERIAVSSGTNIGSGFEQLDAKQHKDATVILITDGQDFGSDNPEAVIAKLRKKFGGTLPSIICIGLGSNYQSHVLNAYGEATNRAHYFQTVKTLRDFFAQGMIRDGLLTVRTPMTLMRDINNQKSTEENPGMENGGEWSNTIEFLLDAKHSSVKGKVTYTTSEGGEIEHEFETKKSGLCIKPDIIDPYLISKANDILQNPFIENEEKRSKLQEVLDICPEACFATRTCIEEWIGKIKEEKPMHELLASGTQYVQQSGMFSSKQGADEAERKLAEYDAKTGMVKIKQINHKMINREIDFITYSGSLVSIGVGIATREKITINREQCKKIVEAYLLDTKPSEQKTLLEKLQSIADYTEKQFPTHKIKSILDKNKEYYPLDDFIEAKAGLCRHRALFMCALAGTLLKDLPGKTSVHMFRGLAYNFKAHAWTIINHTDVTGKKALYLVDATLQGGKIFNLLDLGQAEKARQAYKNAGLEGVLADLHEYYNLSHPVMTEVHEDALMFSGNISDSSPYICAITQEVMRHPVKIVVNGTDFYYEKDAIKAWLEAQNINPSTGLPLTDAEKTLIECPGYTKRISEELQKSMDKMPPEDVTASFLQESPVKKTPPRKELDIEGSYKLLSKKWNLPVVTMEEKPIAAEKAKVEKEKAEKEKAEKEKAEKEKAEKEKVEKEKAEKARAEKEKAEAAAKAEAARKAEVAAKVAAEAKVAAKAAILDEFQASYGIRALSAVTHASAITITFQLSKEDYEQIQAAFSIGKLEELGNNYYRFTIIGLTH